MAYSWPYLKLVSDEILSAVKATTSPSNYINVASGHMAKSDSQPVESYRGLVH